jgi:signal transduction histidine kinase
LAIAGRLAASLTHEISNPLQSVIGCLGLAEETLVEGGDVSQYLDIALPELRRIARIVARLRNLGRPPSLRAAREPTDIHTLLEQVLVLSRKQCQDQGVEVELEIVDDLPRVPLVPDQMQQVFLNLMLNALDATTAGGRIEIHTVRTHQPDGLSIQFTDDGTGISPNVLPHIFDPFYSTKPDGLGLGLFISQDIVRQHGGCIEVASQLGAGTRFAVWLPV